MVVYAEPMKVQSHSQRCLTGGSSSGHITRYISLNILSIDAMKSVVI